MGIEGLADCTTSEVALAAVGVSEVQNSEGRSSEVATEAVACSVDTAEGLSWEVAAARTVLCESAAVLGSGKNDKVGPKTFAPPPEVETLARSMLTAADRYIIRFSTPSLSIMSSKCPYSNDSSMSSKSFSSKVGGYGMVQRRSIVTPAMAGVNPREHGEASFLLFGECFFMAFRDAFGMRGTATLMISSHARLRVPFGAVRTRHGRASPDPSRKLRGAVGEEPPTEGLVCNSGVIDGKAEVAERARLMLSNAGTVSALAIEAAEMMQRVTADACILKMRW